MRRLKKDPFVAFTPQITRTSLKENPELTRHLPPPPQKNPLLNSMTAIHHHKTDLTHTVTRKWSYNRKNVSHCTPVNNHLLNINIKMKITGNYTIVNCLFLESEEDSGCANNSLCDIQREKIHINIEVKRQAILNILKYFYIFTFLK